MPWSVRVGQTADAMSDFEQPDPASSSEATRDPTAPAVEDASGGLSGKVVAAVITAIVLFGAALAWILLPF